MMMNGCACEACVDESFVPINAKVRRAITRAGQHDDDASEWLSRVDPVPSLTEDGAHESSLQRPSPESITHAF